jgi:acyl carrier protein phosphodiesterase
MARPVKGLNRKKCEYKRMMITSLLNTTANSCFQQWLQLFQKRIGNSACYKNTIKDCMHKRKPNFGVALSQMNFLAHAVLSFGDAEILTGNIISDFVKGRSQYNYPARIQQGIRLHRAIDAFTDTHPATKEATNFFKTPYRLYSAPITDIVYDHFLATDPLFFPGETLFSFSQEVYSMLEQQAAHVPPTFARVFTYMKSENWLWHYRSPEGIQRSLRGLARRATYLAEGETAFLLFQQHYAALRQCYHAFMPDVKTFAKQQLEALPR